MPKCNKQTQHGLQMSHDSLISTVRSASQIQHQQTNTKQSYQANTYCISHESCLRNKYKMAKCEIAMFVHTTECSNLTTWAWKVYFCICSNLLIGLPTGQVTACGRHLKIKTWPPFNSFSVENVLLS